MVTLLPRTALIAPWSAVTAPSGARALIVTVLPCTLLIFAWAAAVSAVTLSMMAFWAAPVIPADCSAVLSMGPMACALIPAFWRSLTQLFSAPALKLVPFTEFWRVTMSVAAVFTRWDMTSAFMDWLNCEATFGIWNSLMDMLVESAFICLVLSAEPLSDFS